MGQAEGVWNVEIDTTYYNILKLSGPAPSSHRHFSLCPQHPNYHHKVILTKGVPAVEQWVKDWHCYSCGIGRSCSSDIPSLAQEFPYAVCVWKNKTKQNRKKKNKDQQWRVLWVGVDHPRNLSVGPPDTCWWTGFETGYLLLHVEKKKKKGESGMGRVIKLPVW